MARSGSINDYHQGGFYLKMEIGLILSTFFTIFLAELGDKTQIATLAMSGASNNPYAVFWGSSLALVLACLIGALAGGSISTFIPRSYLELLASIGFIFIGLRLLFSSRTNLSNEAGSASNAPSQKA